MSTSISAWSEGPVKVATSDGGALWQVLLATPKANILDMAKIEILRDIVKVATKDDTVRALVLDSEGPHFSFGASVPEHLPGKVEAMLPSFHALMGELSEASVPLLAAVRGQCLGGALELASMASRIVASPDAKLGQPEIVLGVFAPVASVVLAERVGRGVAEDLCLSGRSLDAAEAHRVGLVDELADDPTEAALTYAREHLLKHSPTSLRLALRAVRTGFNARLKGELAEVERLYLEDLMATDDALEGLQAFLDKREPAWRTS